MKKIILIGAGGRGLRYTNISLEMDGMFQVVAVAEPGKDRREYAKKRHNLPDEMCFESWEELLARPKFADAVLICTMDRMHTKPALAAIEKGYHILLEKPIAPLPEECIEIYNAAKEKGVMVLVSFVLRYSKYYMAIKKLIDDGVIGDVMSIQSSECVGYIHQSHSFVRGNWGNSKESSSMLLQKSCHDMDVLQWLAGKPYKRVSSFGSLSYFTEKNAPKGAPEYCIEGCPVGDKCKYNAVNLYLNPNKDPNEYQIWFSHSSTKKTNPSDEDVEKVLRTTNYGKCVFRCDNDVVDHQVVNLEFCDGTVADLNMNAFNDGKGTIRVMGTKGEIRGGFCSKELEVYHFEENQYEKIDYEAMFPEQTTKGGHGGGDVGLMTAFSNMLEHNDDSVCDMENIIDNHLIVFAAEESRLTGKVVDLKEYKEQLITSMKNK